MSIKSGRREQEHTLHGARHPFLVEFRMRPRRLRLMDHTRWRLLNLLERVAELSQNQVRQSLERPARRRSDVGRWLVDHLQRLRRSTFQAQRQIPFRRSPCTFVGGDRREPRIHRGQQIIPATGTRRRRLDEREGGRIHELPAAEEFTRIRRWCGRTCMHRRGYLGSSEPARLLMR